MAKKEFIFQGFTARTHGAAARELFGVVDVKKVVLSVAFVSESGAKEIENELRANAANAVVFAGVRNDITSHQGMVFLHGLGVALYAVDTGSRTVVFHPKIYLVRGSAHARVLVGSANLTLGGLNNNIEAGMLLDFDLGVADDRAVVRKIESGLLGIPAHHAKNVIKITAVSQLDEMLASGRLVDETAVPPPRPSRSIGGSGASDTVPRIRLKVTPKRRALSKASAAPRRPRPATAAAPTTTPPPHAAIGVDLELVWESKSLTRRDLTIPDAEGTHATGSINLDKGLLPEAVDHRHYFRDDVFANLVWTHRNATVDEATANFELVVKGISYGVFKLAIRHTTSTTTAAYRQNNAMTRLSWGPARPTIIRPDLIGRTLALYRDEADPTRFVLEID